MNILNFPVYIRSTDLPRVFALFVICRQAYIRLLSQLKILSGMNLIVDAGKDISNRIWSGLSDFRTPHAHIVSAVVQTALSYW